MVVETDEMMVETTAIHLVVLMDKKSVDKRVAWKVALLVLLMEQTKAATRVERKAQMKVLHSVAERAE